MDTTTEKIILEKLDKLDNSFEGLKTLIDEEHKKNAVYRYKVDELEKKSSGMGMFWRSVLTGVITAIIGGTFVYLINSNKQPDNKQIIELLEKINKQDKK